MIDGTVSLADAVAGATVTTLARNQQSPEGIALGPQGLFWTNTGSGTIMTMPYLGATPAILATNQSSPDSITTDVSGDVWWVNNGTAANNETDGSVVKSAP